MAQRTVFSICLAMAAVAMLYAQSTEQLMSLGADQLRNGEYSQAVTSFKRVVSRDPGNFEAQFNLALAYLAWGQNENALEEFKKASGINPRSSEVWANMGVAYERLGNRSKAIESLTKAISLNPNNLEARLNLASMYADAGRSTEALAQFKQIIAIDGKNIAALINASRLAASKNNISEAKHYLSEAMAVDPQNGEVHWELGNILAKHEKKLEEAVSEYRKAVSLEPSSQVFYDELGQTLETLGRKQEAIEVYRTYCAYLTDTIKKEEIEKRISRLERSEGSAAADKPQTPVGQAETHDVEALRRRVRSQPATQQQEEVIKVDQSADDILRDLNDVTASEPPPLDLKAEAKKKSREKKQ